jgi:rubrerythrin
MMSNEERATNTSNAYFDLVSVLYHSLEGARTYAIYVRDAQNSGDQELAQFFSQRQQEETNCANQAKQMLSSRITAATMGQQNVSQQPGTQQPWS